MKKIKSTMIIVFAVLLTCNQVGAATYEYDGLGRVKKVKYEDGSTTEYTYDANGNIGSVKTVRTVKPTVAPSPEPTSSPDSTIEPSPPSTPTLEPSSPPTLKPVPTSSPEPEATHAPTLTPRPSPTSNPISTTKPKPSSTPKPTPGPGPGPTAPPGPSPTLNPPPTLEPKPSATPKPTPGPGPGPEWTPKPPTGPSTKPTPKPEVTTVPTLIPTPPQMTEVAPPPTGEPAATVVGTPQGNGDPHKNDDFNPLAEPAAVTVVRKNPSTVRLSWNRVEGATGYEVLRSTASGKGYKVVGDTTGATYTDKKIRKNMKYWYKIRAYHMVEGVKARGEESKAAHANLAKPPAPSRIRVSGGNVRWAGTKDADGYLVYAAKSRKGGYRKVAVIKKRAGTRWKYDGTMGRRFAYIKIRSFIQTGKRRLTSDWSKPAGLR